MALSYIVRAVMPLGFRAGYSFVFYSEKNDNKQQTNPNAPIDLHWLKMNPTFG
jgi:hypothetical protein